MKNNHPKHHDRTYVLKDKINSGAFGIVYKAHCQCLKEDIDEDEKKMVAVKIIEVADTYDKSNALYEAQIQRQLRSVPNIVHLFDFFVYEEKAYFVQELAHGGDVLSRLLEKKRYEEKDAKKLARNLIMTVRALHYKEIVHRDLKPENLLLKSTNNDTKIMLCDFGDAYKYTSEEKEQDDKLFTICGTPAFMAPEIMLKDGYRGKEVDMWSIGCIIFLLIGGYAPFGYDQNIAYERSSEGDYDFKRSPWTTEVSSSAMNFISKLLKVDPEERLTASEALSCSWLSSSAKKIKKKSSSSSDITAVTAAEISSKLSQKEQGVKALLQKRRDPSVSVSRIVNNRQRV